MSYNGDWGEPPGIEGEGWFRPALACDPSWCGSGPLTSAHLSLPTLRAGPPRPREGGRIVQSWCPSHHPWCCVPGRWSWLTTRRWWERGWRQHGVRGCPCADDPEGTGSVKSPGSIRSSGVGGRGEAPEGKSLHISAKETLAGIFTPCPLDARPGMWGSGEMMEGGPREGLCQVGQQGRGVTQGR